MRTLFLSFNDKYFRPLYYGLKKYEYRKRFCNEESICYLYLSGKTRKVIGILKLGKPIKLKKIINHLDEYKETKKRVDSYIELGVENAVPILELSLFKKEITLEKLREKFNGFMPPQMYYDLDKNKALLNYLQKQEIDKTIVVHKHDEIYYNNLCVSVKELEITEEFKNKLKNGGLDEYERKSK